MRLDEALGLQRCEVRRRAGDELRLSGEPNLAITSFQHGETQDAVLEFLGPDGRSGELIAILAVMIADTPGQSLHARQVQHHAEAVRDDRLELLVGEDRITVQLDVADQDRWPARGRDLGRQDR